MLAALLPALRRRPALAASALFVAAMAAMHLARPAAVYAPDGSFRPFGVGYTDRTVLPGWAAAVALAVLSYVAAQHALAFAFSVT